MGKDRKTLVINFFAGPGAGKTTGAWEIGAALKKLGINTEYVPEFAKELVWAEAWEQLQDQAFVTGKQYERLQRLIGKVDVIVTDSPIILGMIYGKDNPPELNQQFLAQFQSFENFNLFIERGKDYQQSGRMQNLDEAVAKDKQILELLHEHKIFFGQYRHQSLGVVVDNIVTTLKRINPEALENAPRVMTNIAPLRIFQESEKAVLVKVEDTQAHGGYRSEWLPRSQIKIDKDNLVIGVAADLAKAKGLPLTQGKKSKVKTQ